MASFYSLEEIKQNIDRLSIVSQIPLSIVKENGETVHCMPNVAHHFVPAKYVQLDITSYKEKNPSFDAPCMHDIDLKQLIGIIPLIDDYFLFVGPTGPKKLSMAELTETYRNDLTPEEIELAYRVNQITLKCDAIRFSNILSHLSFALQRGNLLPMEIIRKNFSYGFLASPEVLPVTPKLVHDLSDSIQMFQPAQEAEDVIFPVSMESVSSFEANLLSAVGNGNRAFLDEIWKNPHLPLEESLLSPENIKLFFIVPLLTLISRVAVSAGVDAGKSFSLYNKIMHSIHNNIRFSEALLIVMDCSYQYCDYVREINGKSNLPEACRMCERYINEHISEKITADDLTKLCGLSKKKLYMEFENYFHDTINDYIQKERLRRAVSLMESTNYSLAQIASSLGYASQSYFTSVFKKYYSCTPGEYLNKKKGPSYKL